MRSLPAASVSFLFAVALFAQPARRAPGFSLPDMNNQQHDLADYRGKVVIVEFMRTNCPECIPFSKKLEEVKTLYGGRVAVLSLTNPPDGPANVAKFVAEQKVTYPILFDCGQVAFSYVRPSPLRPSINIPHIYIVDRDGLIRSDIEFGPNTGDVFLGSGLAREIDKVMAAGPASNAKPAPQRPARKK